MRVVASIALCFILALSLLPAQQAGAVRGTVASVESGEPLAGASISLEGTVLGASSDAQGRFVLGSVPGGAYTLLVSYIGFRPTRISGIMVTAAETAMVDARLEPAPVETGPVIVTAGRREQSADEVPASVSVVPGRLLAERNSVTVDDALRYVPGVFVVQSQVNIRGSSGYSYGVGTRVLLLVDGLPLITGDTGEINWESIPASQIERIEVVKGAASALYGSSALGGVINIITKSPGDQPEGRVRLYGGVYDLPSYPTWRWTDESRSFSGIHGGYLGRLGDAGLALSLDRTVNDGYRREDYWRRWNGSARLGFTISPFQSAGIAFSILEQQRGNFLYWRDFEHAYEPRADQLGESVYSVRWNLSGTYRQFVSREFLVTARGTWFRSRWTDNIPSQYDSAGSRSLSDVLTGELQATYQAGPGQVLIAGLDASLQRVDADTIFGRHDGHGAAAYIQDEFRISPSLRLTAGGRFDYQTIGGLEAVSQFNPKLGLAYAPSDSSSLRISAGRGFRAPAIAEVFTTSTAAGVAIHPNPDLQPERSWSLEMGGSHTFSGEFRADLSLFRNEFWDLIEPGFGSDGVVHFQNITRALIYGAECTVNLNLAGRLIENQLSYTYMVPRDLTTGDILKYRPRHLCYASTQLNLPPFRLGVDARFISNAERIDDSFVTLGIIPGGDQRVPIYVVDARLAADWSLAGRRVSAAFHVNNLLQYSYVELIGNIAPPRNFALSLGIAV